MFFFYKACKNEQTEVVKYLLEKKVKINTRELKNFTALHMATITGNLEIVQMLVDHKAEVNVQNFEKMTPVK
jgi:ankyrin repeat protein